jgi:Cytochrome P460
MTLHQLYRQLRELLAMAAVLAWTIVTAAQPQPSVAYPEGFRAWQHVKSDVVGPEHASFANRGGFHHFYANGTAIEGYRTGKFPNGSVLVDEGVVARNGEDRLKGILLEGERRSIDVMVKDDRVYKDTGGWGFEHFNGSEKTGTLSSAARGKCFECHGMQTARDSVFGTIRP